MKILSIKEVADALQHIQHDNDPIIVSLKNDERKGVQKLLQQWYKQQEKDKEEHRHFEQMMRYEQEIRRQGFERIAGIDEVGRGPLAGPVVAAAVILPEDFYLPGINDSKQLSEKKREEFFELIRVHAIAIGIGVISSEEIDHLNIYEATKKAMLVAMNEIQPKPDYCLIDAMKLTIPIPQTSLIKGDANSASIAAASIIAKVTRDKMMQNYGEQYPQYKFEQNMGYGTKEHIKALNTYGPCSIHRKSFAPVKNCL